MRAIILAAGEGKRLKPYTDNLPKCLVKLKDKPLLQYQLDLLNSFNIKDINVVTGYKQEKIKFKNIKKFYNHDYKTTNMVTTLFCCRELFDGKQDILISYGDIVYNKLALKSILDAKNKINVLIDKEWRRYWEYRMTDPLKDAETLKINEDGNIKEIGKKPKSFDDIEGQYIGVIKVRKDVTKNLLKFYDTLDRNKFYDDNNFKNMYMTSFLQTVIDNFGSVKPVYINNGWLEVDEPSDLNCSKFLKL